LRDGKFVIFELNLLDSRTGSQQELNLTLKFPPKKWWLSNGSR